MISNNHLDGSWYCQSSRPRRLVSPGLPHLSAGSRVVVRELWFQGLAGTSWISSMWPLILQQASQSLSQGGGSGAAQKEEAYKVLEASA